MPINFFSSNNSRSWLFKAAISSVLNVTSVDFRAHISEGFHLSDDIDHPFAFLTVFQASYIESTKIEPLWNLKPPPIYSLNFLEVSIKVFDQFVY